MMMMFAFIMEINGASRETCMDIRERVSDIMKRQLLDNYLVKMFKKKRS